MALLVAAGLVAGCDKIDALTPPDLPAAPTIKQSVWLNQNWKPDDRFWFHHASQGTSTFPVPYSWFVALEQPTITLFSAAPLLIDESYLVRFGFIPSPKKLPDAVGSEPLGPAVARGQPRRPAGRLRPHRGLPQPRHRPDAAGPDRPDLRRLPYRASGIQQCQPADRRRHRPGQLPEIAEGASGLAGLYQADPRPLRPLLGAGPRPQRHVGAAGRSEGQLRRHAGGARGDRREDGGNHEGPAGRQGGRLLPPGRPDPYRQRRLHHRHAGRGEERAGVRSVEELGLDHGSGQVPAHLEHVLVRLGAV